MSSASVSLQVLGNALSKLLVMQRLATKSYPTSSVLWRSLIKSQINFQYFIGRNPQQGCLWKSRFHDSSRWKRWNNWGFGGDQAMNGSNLLWKARRRLKINEALPGNIVKLLLKWNIVTPTFSPNAHTGFDPRLKNPAKCRHFATFELQVLLSLFLGNCLVQQVFRLATCAKLVEPSELFQN